MFDPQTTMDRASCESIARNKELARQWFHHISTGNLDGLRAMTSENWVMVGGPPDLPSGHEGIRMLFEHIGDIDQTWTIEDVIAENDKVVVRATNTCVQESFFGVPGAGITQVFSANSARGSCRPSTPIRRRPPGPNRQPPGPTRQPSSKTDLTAATKPIAAIGNWPRAHNKEETA
jgi:predicted ester cyclase